MATVIVNNKPVDIGNDRINCIEAARRAGEFIPHYCYHEALSVVASCRMCLVEVGDKKPDGTIQMGPKPVPGCQTPVKDGTVIVTNSDRVKKTQVQTLEGLLLNHPLDCPVCDKAGECLLQDYTYGYGTSHSRMIDPKNTPPNKPDIGTNISLFTDRCIMCTRCVRFTREVSGEAELHVTNRGSHSEIAVFPGEHLDNKLASNVVDLCPVGALSSKDFLYKHRVWNLKTRKSVCPDCSTGCSINLDGNKNIVYRLRPRPNPLAQGHFMCDDGRLGYHYINSIERFSRPMARLQGKLTPLPWNDILARIRAEFVKVATSHPDQVVGVLSPFLTCEEAFLAAKFFKGLSPDTFLVMGPVPVVGQDDTYPKTRRGEPQANVKFTIRAEKCPNRKGIEAILRQFQGEVVPFTNVIQAAQARRIRALFVAGGYPPHGTAWISESEAEHFKNVPLIVCQDLLPSALSNFAQYVLPSASFAEKDGCFVNHAGLAQEINWAITPTGETRSSGQVFLDLLERQGLVHARSLRMELAQEIPYFAPLADGNLGEYGIPLETK